MVTTIIVLAGTAFVFVAILAMPVRVDFQVERTGGTRVSWRLRALLGLVRMNSDATHDPATPAGREPGPDRARSRKRSNRSRRRVHLLAMLGTPGFLSRVVWLAGRLAGRVHWSDFHLHARLGLDDPADTGRVFAAIGPLVGHARWRGWDVAIEPSFPDARLDGTCAAAVAVRPLSVIAVVLAFLASPSVWRAARRLRSGR